MINKKILSFALLFVSLVMVGVFLKSNSVLADNSSIGTFRYLKVATSEIGWVSWREIEVYDTNGAKITPVSATASCEWCGYGAAPGPDVKGARGAIDGDPNTNWNAGETACPGTVCSGSTRDAWIQIDLGSAKAVSKVRLMENGNTTTEVDTLTTSTNGTSFTPLTTFTASTTNPFMDRDWLEYPATQSEGQPSTSPTVRAPAFPQSVQTFLNSVGTPSCPLITTQHSVEEPAPENVCDSSGVCRLVYVSPFIFSSSSYPDPCRTTLYAVKNILGQMGVIGFGEWLQRTYPNPSNISDPIVKDLVNWSKQEWDWLQQLYGNAYVLDGSGWNNGGLPIVSFIPETKKYVWAPGYSAIERYAAGSLTNRWSLYDLFVQTMRNKPSQVNPSSQVSVMLGLGDDIPASNTVRAGYNFDGTVWKKVVTSGGGGGGGGGTILPPGCTSTTGFSPITGVPCSSTTGGGGGGTGGSLDISGGSTSVQVTTTPVEFKDGKWTYKFTWNRIRDTQGAFMVFLKSNPSTVVLSVDTAPKDTSSLVNGIPREPFLARLNPNTEYTAEYYSAPGCSKGDLEECVALSSASFTTAVAGSGGGTGGGTSTITCASPVGGSGSVGGTTITTKFYKYLGADAIYCTATNLRIATWQDFLNISGNDIAFLNKTTPGIYGSVTLLTSSGLGGGGIGGGAGGGTLPTPPSCNNLTVECLQQQIDYLKALIAILTGKGGAGGGGGGGDAGGGPGGSSGTTTTTCDSPTSGGRNVGGTTITTKFYKYLGVDGIYCTSSNLKIKTWKDFQGLQGDEAFLTKTTPGVYGNVTLLAAQGGSGGGPGGGIGGGTTGGLEPSPNCDTNPALYSSQTAPASQWCYKGVVMHVQKYVAVEGTAVEPQIVIENPVFGYTIDSQTHLPYMTRFTATGDDGRAIGITAENTQGDLKADYSPYKNHDYKELWLYATKGRKFQTAIYYPASSCSNDSTLKVEKNINLPPGLSFSPCVKEDIKGFLTPDGKTATAAINTLSGTPSSPGVYKMEFDTTQTLASGTFTGKTRIYIVVMDSKKFQDTKIIDPGLGSININNTSPIGEAKVGDRVGIYFDQSNSFTKGTIFDSLSLWVAPGDQSGKFPEDATGKLKIGEFQSGQGGTLSQICNNSTSGGGSALKYGCGIYNWMAGSAQGTTLSAPATYTVFITPKNTSSARPQDLSGLYGNCGGLKTDSAYTGHLLPNIDGCTGYTWGTAKIDLKPASGGTGGGPGGGGGAPVASFDQIDLQTSYSINGGTTITKSRGPHGANNAELPSCGGGTPSGGVMCVGPNASVTLKPGERMHYEWKIRIYDPNHTIKDSAGKELPRDTITPAPDYALAGNSITSRIYVGGNANFNQNNANDMARLRHCTSGIVPGGFDFSNAQGYINTHVGSADISIPADCTDVMGKGISIAHWVGIHVGLNGGGEAVGEFSMGGVNIGPADSGNGLVDCDLHPTTCTGTTEKPNGFTGVDKNTCYVPADSSELGLRCGPASGNTYQAGRNAYNVVFNIPSSWKFDRFSLAADTLEKTGNVNGGCSSPCLLLQFLNNAADRLKSSIEVKNLQPGTTYYNRMVFYCDSSSNKFQAVSVNCSTEN